MSERDYVIRYWDSDWNLVGTYSGNGEHAGWLSGGRKEMYVTADRDGYRQSAKVVFEPRNEFVGFPPNVPLERAHKLISERRDEFQRNVRSTGNALDAYDECLRLIAALWIGEKAEKVFDFICDGLGIPHIYSEDLNKILESLYEDTWLSQVRFMKEQRSAKE